MNSEAYNNWISLFDSKLDYIWQNEEKSLRKAAMLIFTIKQEFHRIQTDLESQMKLYKEGFKSSNSNRKNSSPRDSILKENVFLDLSNKTESLLESDLSDYDPLNSNISLKSDKIFRNLNETSPKINKHRRRTRLKKNKDVAIKSPEVKKYSSDFFGECSLIENTPEPLPFKIHKRTGAVAKKKTEKKKSHVNDKYRTLTQMFGQDEDNVFTLSSETSEENQSGSSYMAIDDILNEINKDPPTNKNKSENDETFLDVGLMKFTGLPKDESLHNTPIPVHKKQMELEASKSNKIKSPQFVYKPEPVRGKARKQLEGWSCNECKDFYGALGLTAEEVKKRMNACSRHRSKFAPPTDTPPGFWDMTIPMSENH